MGVGQCYLHKVAAREGGESWERVWVGLLINETSLTLVRKARPNVPGRETPQNEMQITKVGGSGCFIEGVTKCNQWQSYKSCQWVELEVNIAIKEYQQEVLSFTKKSGINMRERAARGGRLTAGGILSCLMLF